MFDAEIIAYASRVRGPKYLAWEESVFESQLERIKDQSEDSDAFAPLVSLARVRHEIGKWDEAAPVYASATEVARKRMMPEGHRGLTIGWLEESLLACRSNLPLPPCPAVRHLPDGTWESEPAVERVVVDRTRLDPDISHTS